MDQNGLTSFIQILLLLHLFLYVNKSTGDLQNVRTGVELSDSTSKLRCSGNLECVGKVMRDGFLGPQARAGKKGVKRDSQIRGTRRRGSFPRLEDDAVLQISEIASGRRAESATATAHKAFQSYLERSNYFRSHRWQNSGSSNVPRLRSNLEALMDSSARPGRRKLASTAPESPSVKRSLDIDGKPYLFLVVSQAGDGHFTSVQDAVDFVPEGNVRRVIIRIRAGFYRERILVPRNKPFITFHGEGTRSTIISWNATAATPERVTAHSWRSSDDSALFGTFHSASVTVLSDFFTAKNITFKNSAPAPQPGAVNSQAVAFLIAGDSAAFYDCSFLGAQDTLYDYRGRHYYHRCFIQGSIDFIFGNGRTLFENCTLFSIATRFGAIAAHRRQTPDEDTGFSFVGCYVIGTGSVYLGRAWSPFAKIIFSRSYFEDIIHAEGWNDFGDPRRHGSTYFGLYQCSGPGSHPARLVPWSRNLTADEVTPYLGQSYVNGQEWLMGPGENSTLPQDSVDP